MCTVKQGGQDAGAEVQPPRRAASTYIDVHEEVYNGRGELMSAEVVSIGGESEHVAKNKRKQLHKIQIKDIS